MGWVWIDDDSEDSNSFDISEFRKPNSNPNSEEGDRCSTRKIIQSKCNTEEIEPGKFVRKCEKTERILRDCVGRPTEVVKCETEYTEDDMTDQVTTGPFTPGSSRTQPFDFPGLRGDIEAIERSLFGGVDRFFEAAEEMRRGFFHLFDDSASFRREHLSTSRRRGVPVEGKEVPTDDPNKHHIDRLCHSKFAQDV